MNWPVLLYYFRTGLQNSMSFFHIMPSSAGRWKHIGQTVKFSGDTFLPAAKASLVFAAELVYNKREISKEP